MIKHFIVILETTFTVPSRDECLNSITFIIYFSDVTEAHGPHIMLIEQIAIIVCNESFSERREDLEFQKELIKFERSGRPAGTLWLWN